MLYFSFSNCGYLQLGVLVFIHLFKKKKEKETGF